MPPRDTLAHLSADELREILRQAAEDEPELACLNCDAPAEPQTFLFCSERCLQEAKYVRYSRAVRADGRIDRPDVQEALHTRLALILGGGWPEKARKLSATQRAAVFSRSDGRCVQCGAPATEVDHIAGSSADPSNLQALCRTCHQTKTEASFHTVSRAEHPEEWERHQRIIAALEERIAAPEPLRVCDDEKTWNKEWRPIAAGRQELAFDIAEQIDASLDPFEDLGDAAEYLRGVMQRDD